MIAAEGLELEQTYNFFKEVLGRQKLSQATIVAYLTDLKQLLQFLKTQKIKNWTQVNSQHFLDFQKKLQHHGYSAISLARKFNAFRSFFRFLEAQKLINSNPLKDIQSPKISKKQPRILSRMEYRALRDTCRHNPRTAALVEIFLQTGLKVSEVAKLTLNDIKKDKLIIRANQQLPQREIPLTPSLKLALTRYLKTRPKSKHTNLFITKNDTPLLIRNLTMILMRCFQKAEVKNASLNSLRHTWIYYQLLAGVPLEKVAQLAGHKRLNTTANYLALIKKKPSVVKNQIKEL